MMKVLPAVARVEEWMTWRKDPLFGERKPYAEVGKIVGGYEVNIVPDRCEADIDIRTVPTMTQEQIAKDLDALIAKLKKEDPLIDVEVQWIWKSIVPFEGWFTVKDDDPIVKAISEIAPKYTGKVPKWRSGIGGGAGRPDQWALGTKVNYFGVGRGGEGGGGGGAHGIDEWVSVDRLVEQARFNAELALKMLQ
jgi:acetylornithine deacetylase/succinyl-diaminopimelate desuccinylase-like protein